MLKLTDVIRWQRVKEEFDKMTPPTKMASGKILPLIFIFVFSYS
jgi:hypothetical protein